MKISCAKCGKRFDADQYMYICPKCNHYHSQTGKHGNRDAVQGFDDSESGFLKRKAAEVTGHNDLPFEKKHEPETYVTLEGAQTTYRKPKDKEKKKFSFLNFRLIIAVIVLLAMLINMGSIALENTNFNSVWKAFEFSDDSAAEETYTSVEPGTPMEFDTYVVYVGEAAEPDYDGIEAPAGQRYVQINFSTEALEYDDSIDSQVALVCNGQKYYALYEDEITNNPDLQEELWDAGLDIVAHSEYAELWIFEIPQTAETAELEITSYVTEDGGSAWYSELIVDEVQRMPIEL